MNVIKVKVFKEVLARNNVGAVEYITEVISIKIVF